VLLLKMPGTATLAFDARPAVCLSSGGERKKGNLALQAVLRLRDCAAWRDW
jgi:hypothetical protein